VNLPHRNIREWLEGKEENLSPYAAKSRLSRGRQKPEGPCPMRTAFQRDRDRIIHSKAFRRLKHKTQVFIAPLGDHYVTRLTHTLEVSQVARSITRSLNLNEDLTEAIALGHDLGHTPFGHIGEKVLNEISPFGFRHNEQSLRVIDTIEKEGEGINLTWEVREGILKHSKARTDIMGGNLGKPETMEGQVCRIADVTAYINHDIEDALRAGIIRENELPCTAVSTLGVSRSERINTIVRDIVDYSWAARGEDLVVEPGQSIIGMSTKVNEAINELREFMFLRVYDPSAVTEESIKARETVLLLYQYFTEHEECLPDEYIRKGEIPARGVIDYIAGMTDQYALRIAGELGLFGI
jgi:dGTPase